MIYHGNEAYPTALSYAYNKLGIAGFYLYDSQGGNTGSYTYRKNLFGDITAIYQGATCVAKYKYDAWGNCTVCNPDGTANTSASFIGNINPFRYRGYYWDKDLQLYNLQTRWYDPAIGRFISPDSIEYLDPESFGGLNLYGYCLNNPIMYVDPSGHFAITLSTILTAAIIGFAMGTVSGAMYGGLTAMANGQDVWNAIWIGAISGAIMGTGAGIASLFIAPIIVGETVILSGVTLTSSTALLAGVGIAFTSGAVGGATSDVLNQVVDKGRVDNINSIFTSALQWGVINTIGAFLGSIGGPLPNIDTIIATGVFNNFTGVMGLITDVLRVKSSKKKQLKSFFI